MAGATYFVYRNVIYELRGQSEETIGGAGTIDTFRDEPRAQAHRVAKGATPKCETDVGNFHLTIRGIGNSHPLPRFGA